MALQSSQSESTVRPQFLCQWKKGLHIVVSARILVVVICESKVPNQRDGPVTQSADSAPTSYSTKMSISKKGVDSTYIRSNRWCRPEEPAIHGDFREKVGKNLKYLKKVSLIIASEKSTIT